MFLLNKLKKFGTREVALAVQSVLRLFRTGSFDIRTLTMLSRPMRKKNYDDFKRLVSESLG